MLTMYANTNVDIKMGNLEVRSCSNGKGKEVFINGKKVCAKSIDIRMAVDSVDSVVIEFFPTLNSLE